MRTSIATVCLSGTLEEKMHACANAGFDGIEIFEQDLLVSPCSPGEIRSRRRSLGLTLDLYQPFRDFEGVPEQLLADNLYRAEAKFRLMNELGMDLMLLCSNVGTASHDDDDLAAAQLRRLGDLAARYGIRIAYEALAWGKFVNDFEHAMRIVELAAHPNIGTCLDSFHILSRGWDPAGIEKIPAEKIFFVQLADAPELSMDILSWSRHYRRLPGRGRLGTRQASWATWSRSGYNGPVSLEIFNDVFRQADEERTAIDAMRSLIWLEEQTSVHLQEADGPDAKFANGAGNAAPGCRADGLQLRRGESGRHRSDPATAAATGFAHRGRHRTKPVQLWTQGRARIIVNEQQARGLEPTIAALAFDVEDPLIAASRALQLKAEAVPRQSQANEAVLQAVRAPDSTEIFLCEATEDGTSAWTEEFVPDGAAPLGPELITGIDHVNLAQPWQHFDESVLFYESTLSLAPRPSTEVPSPVGLVRSQVMRTDDGKVRLALNIAPLVMERPGPSVASAYPQHIAFACTDVVTLARNAVAGGLEFLKIPANYYADLQARFRLDPKYLATLQELNLLYDRDEAGEFVHFYTATVGSVFFEVVERRNGYDGYGAPNAPVRLSAQYRLSKNG